jgi:hypothetical protein
MLLQCKKLGLRQKSQGWARGENGSSAFMTLHFTTVLCQTPLYALPAFKRPRGKKLAKFMKLIYVYIDWTLLALAVKERQQNGTEQCSSFHFVPTL